MSDETQKIDDGGQAFPRPGNAFTAGYDDDGKPILGNAPAVSGMSTRTWLAGMADVPWNAVIETLENKRPARRGKFTVDEVLEYRAELKMIEADALLAQLRKDDYKPIDSTKESAAHAQRQ